MKSNDIIIGLPTILFSLWDIFKSNAEACKAKKDEVPKYKILTKKNERDLLNVNSVLNTINELLQPWKNNNPTEDECPEELNNPLPTNFGDVSEFMGKPRDEALGEFYSMFDEHISQEFKDAVPIIELLKTKGAKVFVPEKWEGISGIEPLKIDFMDTLPSVLKPQSRPVNPRLFGMSEKEFMRLRGYIYVPCNSPHASCLTVAPKATFPFIRLCGDYRIINGYMIVGHYYIPNVRHQLNRIIEYKIFLDIDLTNAFHQIPLHKDTSEKLSLVTPWGQYRPLFVPEGITPGSGKLQQTIMEIFGDLEWTICMFDNLLVLAKDYQDAYDKFDIILDRCLKHKVILKFPKTWLGFKEVHFFGYNCKNKSYELTNDRKEAILKIPFPNGGNRQKKARSLLGSGNFFAPFVMNYQNIVKHLTDLTKKEFSWEERTWKYDYKLEWEDYKKGLQEACAVFYPDYSLIWILRTDASEFGVAAVLIQIAKDEHGNDQEQVIGIVSHKFSSTAALWATIEQEGYGIFFGVKKFSYYLIGKEFIVETDHNNLRWMEASEVPKIIRWRIYLQSFNFKIRHIKGKDNTVADALSRLFLLQCAPDGYEDEIHSWDYDARVELLEGNHQLSGVYSTFRPQPGMKYLPVEDSKLVVEQEPPVKELKPQLNLELTPEELLSAVHNSQVGHFGVKETWTRLNKQYPGHHIPIKDVQDFVENCANCQKTRQERKHRLIKIKRSLKPPELRTAIGIDAVKVTPTGKEGETHIIVVLNLFAKHVYLYPVKGVTAKNLATGCWKYWCNFGHTDMVISDQGPDLTSNLFQELTQLMGMRHVFSIADKHANGTERTIKEVCRHLRAMVYDERITDVFDDPTIIPSVQYILNSFVSSETGYTPFELMFGSTSVIYSKLLDKCKSNPANIMLQKLNENLQTLHQISKEYQDKLVIDRHKDQSEQEQNSYQPNDLVLFDAGPKPSPKLAARYKGPFEVVHQYKNDVDCRDLITGAVKRYSVEDLEPFIGTKEDGYDAALRDQEQFVVEKVLAYQGDSRKRTELQLQLKYADGEVLWLPWTPDLQHNDAYYQFCSSKPYLFHLTLDTKMAQKFITQKRKERITDVQPGDEVYIDLRFFGDLYYESLGLPDYATTSYVTLFQYTKWYNKGKSTRKIVARYENTKQVFMFDNYLVYAWGSQREFDPNSMVLMNFELASKYPRLLEVDGPVDNSPGPTSSA